MLPLVDVTNLPEEAERISRKINNNSTEKKAYGLDSFSADQMNVMLNVNLLQMPIMSQYQTAVLHRLQTTPSTPIPHLSSSLPPSPPNSDRMSSPEISPKSNNNSRGETEYFNSPDSMKSNQSLSDTSSPNSIVGLGMNKRNISLPDLLSTAIHSSQENSNSHLRSPISPPFHFPPQQQSSSNIQVCDKNLPSLKAVQYVTDRNANNTDSAEPSKRNSAVDSHSTPLDLSIPSYVNYFGGLTNSRRWSSPDLRKLKTKTTNSVTEKLRRSYPCLFQSSNERNKKMLQWKLGNHGKPNGLDLSSKKCSGFKCISCGCEYKCAKELSEHLIKHVVEGYQAAQWLLQAMATIPPQQ